MPHIMVLNDGTTYSDVIGCKIVWIDDTVDPDEVEDVLKNLKLHEDRGRAELITEFK